MGSTTGVSSLDSSRPEGGFLFACCCYTGPTRWGRSYAQGQPTQERGPQQAPSPLDDCAHGGGRRALGSQRHQWRTRQGSRTRCALRVHTEPIMMNQRRMLTRTRCGGDQAPESGGMGSDCHAAVRIVIFSMLALPRITSLMACTIHWPTRPLDTRFRGSFRAS